jgi:glycosyltransferase involved in cell wall biosynthesis
MAGVDVFVPCYNYGRYLEGCVESVLSQDGCSVRVLIIDDTSTDDSLAEARRLAAADPRVEVLAHPVNKGHIATYNEGIAWARAEYVTLLSADDLLAPEALARAIGVMEAHPNVGFVHGRLSQFADDGELGRQTALARATGPEAATAFERGLDFIRSLCERPENMVPASGVIVRTKLQQAVGGYRPELPHSGDLEMWLRLAAEADVAIVDAAQSFTRLHASNMRHQYNASRMEADYRQRQLAFEFFFDAKAAALAGGAALAQSARRSLAWEVLSAASRCFDEGDRAVAGRLLKLAGEVDGSMRRVPSWWKVALKQKLGPRISRVLSPLLQTVGS